MQVPISTVIITFNEATNIARCIQSVSEISDEILIVDSFSTDNTKEIAESLGATFIQNKFDGHIQQKNFAMQKAKHDIVLSLDADEELSSELKESIKEIKKHWTHDAYQVNRLNNYCGTFIYHGGWYPDKKIRLWDRRKGRWGGENPHDRVIMDKDSKIKRVKGNLLHYTYRTPSEHLAQMNKFSDIAANEAFKKGKKTSVILHLVLYPWFTFIKSYFLKLGFLDGSAGYQVAFNAAYYRFLKYSKLRMLTEKRQ